MAEQTDVLWLQGLTWDDLAIVLLAEGRHDDADAALLEALSRFERKGATALADRVGRRQAAIGSA